MCLTFLRTISLVRLDLTKGCFVFVVECVDVCVLALFDFVNLCFVRANTMLMIGEIQRHSKEKITETS